MTIEINSPELETLIRRRLQTGQFQNVEELLLRALGANPPEADGSAPANAQRRIQREDGVWVLHAGQPLPPALIEDTIEALRRERDQTNLGPLG